MFSRGGTLTLKTFGARTDGRGQFVAEKMSHGQIVARTKRRGQNVAVTSGE
jgi:hypothetical protein